MSFLEKVISFFRGFNPNEGFDSKKAWWYVKTNNKYLSKINPEDKQTFESIFTELAKEQLLKKKYLNVKDIDLLVNRARMKLLQENNSNNLSALISLIQSLSGIINRINQKTDFKQIYPKLKQTQKVLNSMVSQSPNLFEKVPNLSSFIKKYNELVLTIEFSLNKNIPFKIIQSKIVDVIGEYNKMETQEEITQEKMAA